MFAFSQIIAEGENPTKIANQLDLENSKRPKDNGLSEDQAVAAFSEFISNDEVSDPAAIADAKQQKESQSQATQ